MLLLLESAIHKYYKFQAEQKLCECLVLPIMNYFNTVCYRCLDKYTRDRMQYNQNGCCRFLCRIRKYGQVSARLN